MWQGTHQVAQKFTRWMLPSRSSCVCVTVGSVSDGSENAGAGRSSRAEGTMLGSRPSPIHSSPAISRKTATGMKSFTLVFTSGLHRQYAIGLRRARGHGRRLAAVTLVGDRGDAAERHQEGAHPDPEHEGLVVQAHHPFDVAALIAERGEEIAEQADVDTGLGLHVAARKVGALLRPHVAVESAVLVHAH